MKLEACQIDHIEEKNLHLSNNGHIIIEKHVPVRYWDDERQYIS